jgi:hypothetical protein
MRYPEAAGLQTRMERVAWSVICPKCYAGPGRPCFWAKGSPRSFHNDRAKNAAFLDPNMFTAHGLDWWLQELYNRWPGIRPKGGEPT